MVQAAGAAAGRRSQQRQTAAANQLFVVQTFAPAPIRGIGNGNEPANHFMAWRIALLNGARREAA